MKELSVAEQRYQAVLAVISDGLSISQVASKVGVSRQTLHAWLARYEAEGPDWLMDRSHRPASCPHHGDLRFHRTWLDVPHSGGQVLLMYHAEPGSESAKALLALRSISGPAPRAH